MPTDDDDGMVTTQLLASAELSDGISILISSTDLDDIGGRLVSGMAAGARTERRGEFNGCSRRGWRNGAACVAMATVQSNSKLFSVTAGNWLQRGTTLPPAAAQHHRHRWCLPPLPRAAPRPPFRSLPHAIKTLPAGTRA